MTQEKNAREHLMENKIAVVVTCWREVHKSLFGVMHTLDSRVVIREVLGFPFDVTERRSPILSMCHMVFISRSSSCWHVITNPYGTYQEDQRTIKISRMIIIFVVTRAHNTNAII